MLRYKLRSCGIGLHAFLFLTMLNACDSQNKNPIAVTEAVDLPVQFPAAATISTDQGVAFPNVSEPTAPTLPVKLPVINAGAESADKADLLLNDPIAEGFSIMGDCRYSDAATAEGNGAWHFELLPGCTMTQLTEATLNLDQALSLTFNVHSATQLDTSIEAELFALDADGGADGTETLLANKKIDLKRDANDWQAHQVASGIGQHDDYANQVIGIRFRNVSDSGAVSLDAISLQAHNTKPRNNLTFLDQWNWQCEQAWAGQQFWSNRLQDWRVHNQRIETVNPSIYRPQRTTHRVSTALSAAPTDFALAVRTGVISNQGAGAFSGFLIGAGQGLDYRAASLIHNRHGRNGGLIIGVDGNNQLFIHDNGVANRRLANSAGLDPALMAAGTLLQLQASYQTDGHYLLDVFALDDNDQVIGSTSTTVPLIRLMGAIALISNPGQNNTSHWFDDWKGFGPKLQERSEREFGPVLFSSYTQSQGILTVNAQYPPVCSNAFAPPKLQVKADDQWKDVATATIDSASFTAQFRVSNWDASRAHQYRIVTTGVSVQSGQTHFFTGVIQADPVDQDKLVIGVYNCRPGMLLSETEGWIQQNNLDPFTWTRERIAFPHQQLIENSAKLQPDLLAFLGDQIYEFDPNGIAETSPELIFNDYLWKWFQFGWSVRELMRNTPAFIIPDDHDVYQGNIWGQNGIATADAKKGGYVHSAEFVNAVQRTQAGSLPPPYDPTPVEQDIGVYYTNLVYGGVGMAVLEDRKFKSGANSGESQPQLLGERQHTFLDDWARNWQGQKMKLAFSQSPLSQSTTHSGEGFKRVGSDRDSNGWPQRGRDQAVRLLRRASAPHIAGDQHLGMLLQHGVDSANDAIYSFAGPSMLNVFPRIWDPLNEGDGPGDRADPYNGTFNDAHGNLITVLAAANPAVYYRPVNTRSVLDKDDLGIGYGMVTVDKSARRFTFAAWPANQDPLTGEGPYAGWPVTIEQSDNDGRIPTGYLAPRQAVMADSLVEVVNEQDGSLVYARRSTTTEVLLPVFDNAATYRVTLSDPDGDYQERWTNQVPVP